MKSKSTEEFWAIEMEKGKWAQKGPFFFFSLNGPKLKNIVNFIRYRYILIVIFWVIS